MIKIKILAFTILFKVRKCDLKIFWFQTGFILIENVDLKKSFNFLCLLEIQTKLKIVELYS